MPDRFTSSRKQLIAARARGLRASLTPSEMQLWACLRGRRLGVTFRRQLPLLDRFIVDFLAPAQKLAVEVDGGYHELRRAADGRRDEALRCAGYRVLRLRAELVMKDLPRAVALVREALAGSEALLSR